MANLLPIKLKPAFKDYLWGGSKLKNLYNKKTDLDIVAESWELSAHKDGESIVADGSCKGMTLTEYIAANGHEILGSNAEKFDYFPILIKFIDAKNALSVQVHPDDTYALEHEGEYGKTEMWYILDCEPGASLYYGFSRDITKEEFSLAIENNTLTYILNEVPVHKGDVFFVPSGTVHAIGAGIIICEIQQNSNTTYRVYDYNRRDKNGNTRPLHIDKAIAVSTLSKAPDIQKTSEADDITLAECKYFTVRRLTVNGAKTVSTDKASFCSLIITDGSGALAMGETVLKLNKGDSVFIPAQDGKIILNGKLTAILSQV